jgi:uncharacterized membrane protein YeaQ/YmgE (transglycosylase-associated protein family)
MSRLRSLLPSRGIVFGIFATIAIGLMGSWAARLLGANFAQGSVHDYVTISAAFVVGAIGGAFGRHVSGLLALWLGVVSALLIGVGLEPPTFGPMSPPVAALLITGAGYALGRMVDPIWGGRTT